MRPASALFTMGCVCCLPSCRTCSGGCGPAAVAPEHGGAPVPCACLMLSCKQCSPEVLLEGVADSEESVESGEESDEPESSDMEKEDRAGVGTCAGPAGIDAARPQGPAGTDAARPQCMRFMPGCVSCQGVTVVASGSQPHKHKRRQKRELPPGHSKCSLREELEIDTRMHQGSRGHPAGHAERCAVLSVAFLLMAPRCPHWK